MDQLFIGMDGGGTKTRALLFSHDGSRHAIAESAGCNPMHGDAEFVTKTLNDAVDAACVVWKNRYGEEFDRSRVAAYFLGSAGFSAEDARLRLLDCFRIKNMENIPHDVRSDMYTTLVGGLEGRPGISFIVGTGSACLAEDEQGRLNQTGGWECLAADEGSCYDVGLQGIRLAVRMADGRLPETAFKESIFHALGIKTTPEIVDRLHQPPISKAEVASLAVHVFQAAANGDVQALKILERAAEEIAVMAETSHRLLPTGPYPLVAVAGGAMRSDCYRKLVFDAIRKKLPNAKVALASLPSVVGAGLLAVKLAGLSIPPGLTERLREEFGEKIV